MNDGQATSHSEQANLQTERRTNGEWYEGHPSQGGLPALTSDARQKELLATVAHELRNPIGCIRNAVQVLRLLNALDPRAAPTHDLIERQALHMTRLIEDLLDAVRISEGKIVPQCESVELGQVVRNSLDDSRIRLEEAGLSLTLEWPSEPVFVQGDPDRIYQILSNLLHNAIKFTETGGHIGVSLEPSQATDAVICIRDTGVGIDPEMLAHLFEPFTQSERTRLRSRGGLGLGLSLVRSLARLQGGDIHAASPGIGRGSEFRVRLVRDPPDGQPAKGPRDMSLEAFEDDGNPPAPSFRGQNRLTQ